MRPVARKSRLLLRDLADEVVVYDLERHEAHCLSRAAAIVFRNADGRRSVADLAALLSTEHAPEAEGLVEMALGQLGDAHLLESAPPPVTEAGLARRDVMRRVGIGAALLLPLVTSILAPSPAEALVTCVSDCGGQPNGTACTSFGPGSCTGTFFCICGGTCSTGDCSDGGGA
jgi:hypothetical protein